MRDRDAMVCMMAGMIATGNASDEPIGLSPGTFWGFASDGDRNHQSDAWIDLAEYMVDEIVARGDKRESDNPFTGETSIPSSGR